MSKLINQLYLYFESVCLIYVYKLGHKNKVFKINADI